MFSYQCLLTVVVACVVVVSGKVKLPHHYLFGELYTGCLYFALCNIVTGRSVDGSVFQYLFIYNTGACFYEGHLLNIQLT
jgi:hypothetical protein